MLKIIYKNCAGIDVHKKVIVVTIAKTNNDNITTYETKSFYTFTSDLKNCLNWLKDNEIHDVCMESTGKYWIPIFNVLETELNCIITHPKYVRSLPGKKTDKKDSKWIADMFKHGLVEPSFMPPADIRQLRDLMRYRTKLVNMRSSEKNRFQNSLTVSNVQIASVVTDVFGKTSQSIIKLMLDKPNLTLNDITPLLKKNLKSSPEEILKSIDGTFDNCQSSKMTTCLKHYEILNECIDSIEQEVLKLIVKYNTEFKLLLTIPGVSEISAIFIIAEIGSKMNVFSNDKHLTSWAGLTPRCNESANKKKSVRITKAGIYIKPILVQCALCAIKDKSCPYIKARYESLKRRRGHKKAIIAIARLLLVSAYHILDKQEVFDLDRFDELMNRNIKKHNKSVQNKEDMIAHLTKLGYTVTSNDAT